jgi:hypothetical protein
MENKEERKRSKTRRRKNIRKFKNMKEKVRK